MKQLIVLFVLFCFSFQDLIACDCKTIPLNLQAIEATELIFSGKVVALSGCDKTAKATFSVDELYRGKCFANVEIEFDCTSDCQMSFAPGETWIIYATYKKYGEALVEFCGYSRKQFPNEQDDFNSTIHGMTFKVEQDWLKKNLGLQTLNIKDQQVKQLHENVRPAGFQMLMYLGLGFLGLILIYFISKKIFK